MTRALVPLTLRHDDAGSHLTFGTFGTATLAPVAVRAALQLLDSGHTLELTARTAGHRGALREALGRSRVQLRVQGETLVFSAAPPHNAPHGSPRAALPSEQWRALRDELDARTLLAEATGNEGPWRRVPGPWRRQLTLLAAATRGVVTVEPGDADRHPGVRVVDGALELTWPVGRVNVRPDTPWRAVPTPVRHAAHPGVAISATWGRFHVEVTAGLPTQTAVSVSAATERRGGRRVAVVTLTTEPPLRAEDLAPELQSGDGRPRRRRHGAAGGEA